TGTGAGVRTLTGRDALKRCKQVLPNVARYQRELESLIDLRNGAVHYIGGGEALSNDMLLGFFGLVNEVASFLGETLEGILGEFAPLFADQVKRIRTEAERRVSRKLF